MTAGRTRQSSAGGRGGGAGRGRSPRPCAPASGADVPSVRLYASGAATYALQVFAFHEGRVGPQVSTAELDLAALRALRAAVDAAIDDLAHLTSRAPDVVDMADCGVRDPRDRRLALAVARDALRAVRVPDGGPPGRPWAYFDAATALWWAVTDDAMVELADCLADNLHLISAAKEAGRAVDRERVEREVVAAWVDADRSAVELDDSLQDRLSAEHPR